MSTWKTYEEELYLGCYRLASKLPWAYDLYKQGEISEEEYERQKNISKNTIVLINAWYQNFIERCPQSLLFRMLYLHCSLNFYIFVKYSRLYLGDSKIDRVMARAQRILWLMVMVW